MHFLHLFASLPLGDRHPLSLVVMDNRQREEPPPPPNPQIRFVPGPRPTRPFPCLWSPSSPAISPCHSSTISLPPLITLQVVAHSPLVLSNTIPPPPPPFPPCSPLPSSRLASAALPSSPSPLPAATLCSRLFIGTLVGISPPPPPPPSQFPPPQYRVPFPCRISALRHRSNSSCSTGPTTEPLHV